MLLPEVEAKIRRNGITSIELDWLIARVRELEFRLKATEDALAETMNVQGKRILELEEAIRKHREAFVRSTALVSEDPDEELYAVLDK